MAPTETKPSVLLLADPEREAAVKARVLVEDVLQKLGIPFRRQSTNDPGPISTGDMPSSAIVIGGDGTMIAQARRLVDHDIPMIGINCGRLGFLAAFNPESFAQHASHALSHHQRIERRMMLQIHISAAAGQEAASYLAMNDGVITAGEPFRMIRMSTTINGQNGPTFAGDGLVVATPTGSTGHSASSGGPIVDPLVNAIIASPMGAQSLSFRPFALDGEATLEVVLEHVNAGTCLVLDGQRRVPLGPRDRIRFSRYAKTMGFVACPGRPFWRILYDKLGWAAPPRGRDDTMSSS